MTLKRVLPASSSANVVPKRRRSVNWATPLVTNTVTIIANPDADPMPKRPCPKHGFYLIWTHPDEFPAQRPHRFVASHEVQQWDAEWKAAASAFHAVKDLVETMVDEVRRDLKPCGDGRFYKVPGSAIHVIFPGLRLHLPLTPLEITMHRAQQARARFLGTRPYSLLVTQQPPLFFGPWGNLGREAVEISIRQQAEVMRQKNARKELRRRGREQRQAAEAQRYAVSGVILPVTGPVE